MDRRGWVSVFYVAAVLGVLAGLRAASDLVVFAWAGGHALLWLLVAEIVMALLAGGLALHADRRRRALPAGEAPRKVVDDWVGWRAVFILLAALSLVGAVAFTLQSRRFAGRVLWGALVAGLVNVALWLALAWWAHRRLRALDPATV